MKVHARWNALAILLALTTMLACQGLSAAPSNQSGGHSSLALSASSLDFGKVVAGGSRTLTITATNTEPSAVIVSSVASTAAEFSFNRPLLPLTIAAGESTALSFTFTPNAARSATGTISILSNASNSPVTVSLSGTGVAPGQLSAPASISFGTVILGSRQTKSATLTNTGGSTVTISQATVSGTGFQLGGPSPPITLNPGQSASVSVVFAPQTGANDSGWMSLTTSASTWTSAINRVHAHSGIEHSANTDAAATTTTMVTIALSGQGVPPGQLAFAPASLSFGNVGVGTSQNQPVTMTNSGGSTVTVSQATVTGTGFSVIGLTLPLTLAAGQSTNFSVTLTPRAAGAANGNIGVTSDASNSSLNLPLSGAGVTPGLLTANPGSMALGSVLVGSSQKLSGTLTNSGGESVTVSQATLTGTGFSLSGLALPLTLAAGQSANFSVAFLPQAAGAANGNIVFASDASNLTLNVPLSGSGVAPGSLSPTPPGLNFSNVQVGNNQTLAETLTNSGGSSVTITQAAVTGSGFTVNGLNLPLTLTPGQSSPSFNVVFTPQAAGAATGTLSLTSNASNPTLNIPLSGTGVAPGSLTANPPSLSFGNVQVGNNQTLAETLTNSGGSSVTITQAAVTGSGFTVNGLNLPLTLTPGQSSPSFNVVFAPQSAGAASGTLSLTSNASNPTLNIPLSGTGVTPGTLTANPSSLSFGNVQVGNNQTLAETLTNSGGSGVTITQAAVTGSGFTVNGLNLPLTLAPGQSSPSFNVVFAPQSAGAATGILSLTSNASNPALNIPLSGTGVTPGTLTANPSSLGFGNVQVGNNQTLSETVTNVGGSSVTISQDTVTGTAFSVTGLNPPVILTSGQSMTFSVIFTPSSAGSASGSLAVASNASNPTLNIPLSGTGTAAGQLAVTPATLAFGNVVVGTSANLPATLSANGASVTVTSANVSSSEFTLSGLSLPVTIPAGNNVQFTVAFTPQSTGAASGTVSFASNASNSPALSLSGTGTPTPVHSVFLSWTASTSSNVIGYNIYRGTASAGPYSKINSSLNAGTTYTDNSVVDGQTYYYVSTAVDSNNQESAHSSPPQQAVIPPP
jgi:Abnormal spindle-like microcephaly-assoc'd, ASPM-SPD-2-Hydin